MFQDVRILLYQENNMWIAQCLSHDFATQGRTSQSALDTLERVMLGQEYLDIKNGIEPLSEIEPAPKWLWDMFKDEFALWSNASKRAFLSFENSLDNSEEVQNNE